MPESEVGEHPVKEIVRKSRRVDGEVAALNVSTYLPGKPFVELPGVVQGDCPVVVDFPLLRDLQVDRASCKRRENLFCVDPVGDLVHEDRVGIGDDRPWSVGQQEDIEFVEQTDEMEFVATHKVHHRDDFCVWEGCDLPGVVTGKIPFGNDDDPPVRIEVADAAEQGLRIVDIP
jgi:hypothetical protein